MYSLNLGSHLFFKLIRARMFSNLKALRLILLKLLKESALWDNNITLGHIGVVEIMYIEQLAQCLELSRCSMHIHFLRHFSSLGIQ